VQIDEKTLEALLQLDIEYIVTLRSIVGRGYVHDFGCVILVSEIPIFVMICSNLYGKNGQRQYLVGSFTGAVSS
jgi:hypothetical protein